MSETFLLPGEIEFRKIADHFPTLCWMADHDGIIIYRNKRWYEYCGVPESVGLAADWLSYYDQPILTHLLENWRVSIATGVDFKETYPLRSKDNTYRNFQTHAVPIYNQGSIVRWLGISVDITERLLIEDALQESEMKLSDLNKNLETIVEERTEALQKTEEQLRQSQKMEAVGQLTGGIAHDFNNILTSIMGNLELLQIKLQNKKYDDLERFVINAQASGQRAAMLTQRLLAFSRRQTLAPKPISLMKLINDILDMLKRTMGPSIQLNIFCTAQEDIVLIDGPQLENALLNLCINSRDAMPDGGVISIYIHDIEIAPDMAKVFDILSGEYLQIKLVDTGCGIPSSIVEKVFDPFFTTKPIGQGTGLGLSMVYGFSRQSKGHVTLGSEIDVGTTICIYLPKYKGAAVMEAIVKSSSMETQSHKGNILLVDDEASIRYLLVEVLESAGYTVTTAEDGVCALKILESDILLDLLITDVGLPNGLNGKQVADAGRVLRKDLKVLFITGYAEQCIMEDNVLDDTTELLVKPFGLHEVIERSRKLLNQ